MKIILSEQKPYFNVADIEEIYEKLTGTRNGLKAFMTEAITVAKKCPISDAYIFKDEEALFRVFERKLPRVLSIKKIGSWGELMQFIS